MALATAAESHGALQRPRPNVPSVMTAAHHDLWVLMALATAAAIQIPGQRQKPNVPSVTRVEPHAR